ncbi:hypothetical protein [Marinigracilibium pacificum]|uniref:Uncharacterized protein n=1 Tax=Marinigracilibium pacificum TaxID=2729599 RepID=A0A848J696_9BACT|nr:hypothetical protein [Marinigracilibium pacificum]NMM50040.1 hypothetical protein [Marinigracilibium pacificum]
MEQINCWKSESLLMVKQSHRINNKYTFNYYVIDINSGDTQNISDDHFEHLLSVLNTQLLEPKDQEKLITWVKWQLQKHIYRMDDLYMI